MGVIYILVREEVLKADELLEETGGEEKGKNPQSQENPARGRGGGDKIPAGAEGE